MQLAIPLVRLTAMRLPAHAMFSGRTAAWLHGLDVRPCDPVEVTVPRLSTSSRLAGAALLRSDFTESETAVVHGLRASSPIRTAADLGRRLSLVDAVSMLDMALHRRLVSVADVALWAESHHGFRGIKQLRRAIDLSDARSESPMETRLRLLLRFNGLPKPEVQTTLYDPAGLFIARPDLFYRRDRS